MCDVSYVNMAQIAIGAVGQAQAARRNAAAATNAGVAGMWGLAEQTHEYDQQQTDQMTDRARKAMADVGFLNAVFADSGLSGNSQDRIKNVTEGQALADLTTLERNIDNRASQTTADRAQIQARTQSQINSVPGPSLWGTGLQIAGEAAKKYDKDHPNGR